MSDPTPPDPDRGSPAEGSPEEAARLRDFAARFTEVRREELKGVPVWIAEGRWEEIVRLGHQIKGTAPTFGLSEVGAAGARLEVAASAEDAGGVEKALADLGALLDSP